MLRRMRGIEVMATAIVSAATIPFFAAWDAKGPGSQKYRKTVRNIYGTVVATLVATLALLAGMGCAVTAYMTSIVYRKDGNIPGRHPNAYLYRRSYRGRHYGGTPLHMLLTTKELAVAVAS